MKKVWGLIIAGIVAGVLINQYTLQKPVTIQEKSNEEQTQAIQENIQQTEEANLIYNALQTHLDEFGGKYGAKTSWYDNIKEIEIIYPESATIKTDLKEEDKDAANKIAGAVLGFFNSKLTPIEQKVKNVIILDKNGKAIVSIETL